MSFDWVKQNELLSKYSTFGIGGVAKYFISVSNLEELKSAFIFAKKNKVKIHMLGKGSNSIFDDRGFNGLVILNKIDFCRFEQNLITVGSGYNFSLLGIKSAKRELTGLEFACGIPATVGGAIYMNAGANGQETSDCLKEVSFLTSDMEKINYSKEDLKFRYRYSSFQKMSGAIVSACFELADKKSAKIDQRKIIDYRIKTQPYDKKSVGCIFQNPEKNVFAGKLIEQCGLKGKSIGGAMVSDKHSNFIINEENCTAQDVKRLIYLIQKTVKEKTKMDLITEVRFIPYDE